MEAELKKKWIDALNNYSQCIGQLRDCDNNYCCLGVLCDISNYGEWEDKGNGDYRYRESQYGNCNDERLPLGMVDSIGLDLDDEEVLINMNDSGCSFKEIGEWIDENVN